jgi:hypothetical protein
MGVHSAGPVQGPPEPPPPGPLRPPLVVRRLAFTVVLLVVAASAVVTVTLGFRPGGYVLAGALGLATLARLVLPESLCLGLLVRSRRLDVTITLVLALAVLVSTATAPGAAR